MHHGNGLVFEETGHNPSDGSTPFGQIHDVLVSVFFVCHKDAQRWLKQLIDSLLLCKRVQSFVLMYPFRSGDMDMGFG